MIRRATALAALALSGTPAMQTSEARQPTGNPVPPPMILSACEDPDEWSGGQKPPETDRRGIRWDHAQSAALSLKNVPGDWTAYNTLSLDIHSRTATGSRFLVYIGSENPQTEGIDYYSGSIRLDFTGWRTFTFPLSSLGSARSPLGWDRITSFRFTASGWGNTPHPDAVVLVDNLQLLWTPPVTGPRLTDKDFFDALDLDRPELAAVAEAVRMADYAAARRAFVEHIKTRQRPRWHFDWRERPRHATRPENVNTAAADRIAAHILTSCGIPHDFGEDIDWSINPTELKYKEWTWQLSRHPFWTTLGRAYWETGDEKYARDFVFQMTDWVTDNPVPVNNSGNSGGSRWRTIETGIRMFSSWPGSFFYFLSSPSFDDDSVVLMVKSTVEHARHLMAHPTRNNWLAMEMNGLFHVGVLFPEFEEAETWRRTAAGRLYEEMNIQVYPDGAQVELSTGYHGVSLHNFLGTMKLAQLNSIELPGDYARRLEKMYDYYLKLLMPDGRLPALNDSGWGDGRGPLRQGVELFPERADFEFGATAGKGGTPPAFTSVHFPYAGWAVMRSGWGPQDLYLHFEYGPYGAGHQHEDKLSLVLHAYGARLLTEGGVYAYDSSQWRRYVLSARAHNVVMVDGMEQNRRGLAETYVIDTPLPNRWISTDQFDFAEGWYDEGFGRERDRTVTHIRSVLFIKPEYWLVIDRFVPSDAAAHRYDAVFHFDTDQARITQAPLAAISAAEHAPNLAVVPLLTSGISVELVSGQEEPTVQGWVPAGGYTVRPVATPVFSTAGQGALTVPWLLYPLRTDEALPVTRVEHRADSPGVQVFTVFFARGRRDELRVQTLDSAPSAPALQWTSRQGDDVIEAITVPQG